MNFYQIHIFSLSVGTNLAHAQSNFAYYGLEPDIVTNFLGSFLVCDASALKDLQRRDACILLDRSQAIEI